MQTKKTKKSANAVIIAIMTAIFCIMPSSMQAQNAMTRDHLPARKTVTEARLKEQMSILCNDMMEGRGAGTKGNALTALYLQKEFEDAGLMKMGESYASPFSLGNGKTG